MLPYIGHLVNVSNKLGFMYISTINCQIVLQDVEARYSIWLMSHMDWQCRSMRCGDNIRVPNDGLTNSVKLRYDYSGAGITRDLKIWRDAGCVPMLVICFCIWTVTSVTLMASDKVKKSAKFHEIMQTAVMRCNIITTGS